MAKLHVNVKKSSILVYVSVRKRGVQTVLSSEVNHFFKVFIRNLRFCVVDCDSFVHCAFAAEEFHKNFIPDVKKSEQLDLLRLEKMKTCGNFNFH